MTPRTVVESIFQGASDSVAENGWAYGAGKIAPDVVLAFVGTKGLDKALRGGQITKNATQTASTVKKLKPVRGRPIQSVTAKIKPREIPRLAKKLTPEELSKIKKLKEGRVDNVSEAVDAAMDASHTPSNVKVPTVKSGEFNEWFNSLSVDELDALWNNKSTRKAIERQLRAPGGMHEWHLVSRAPQFKYWGLSAEKIRDLRTVINDVEFVNPIGKHGKLGSTIAHNELLGIIGSSSDYNMFTRRLNNWANYRLSGGIKSLPDGLRIK